MIKFIGYYIFTIACFVWMFVVLLQIVNAPWWTALIGPALLTLIFAVSIVLFALHEIHDHYKY